MTRKKHIQSDGNGGLIISKKLLVPVTIIVPLLMFFAGLMGMAYGLQEEVHDNTAHSQDIDIHQPFKEKYEMWYTRDEGEDLESAMIQVTTNINDINRKLDVLIATQER